MPGPARAGALIYAKDPGLLTHFYRTLLQMVVCNQDEQLVVLENSDIQLLIHAIPEPYAGQVVIKRPPALREEGAIKLFLHRIQPRLGGSEGGGSRRRFAATAVDRARLCGAQRLRPRGQYPATARVAGFPGPPLNPLFLQHCRDGVLCHASP